MSRSDRRDATDPVKEAALSQEDGPAVSRTEDMSQSDPRDIGRALLAEFGFSADQFGCLDSLWISESDWRVDADNPTSSAYGIPQALPGSTMTSRRRLDDLRPSRRSAGAWATSRTLRLPCSAWSFKQANNWY